VVYLLVPGLGTVLKVFTAAVWVLWTPQFFEALKALVLVQSRGLAFGHLNGEFAYLYRTHYHKHPGPFLAFPYVVLAVWAAVCLAVGWIIHPWNPIVKRICTTSFTIYSTGWVLLMLLAFYWLVEVRGYRKWTFPLVVIGANSIFMYSIHMVLQGWLRQAVDVFTFKFDWLGDFAPVAQTCAVFLVTWYLCYWLYQRKIFLKL